MTALLEFCKGFEICTKNRMKYGFDDVRISRCRAGWKKIWAWSGLNVYSYNSGE
jgi:hypothetical protein